MLQTNFVYSWCTGKFFKYSVIVLSEDVKYQIKKLGQCGFPFLNNSPDCFCLLPVGKLDHLYIAVTFYEETWRSCRGKWHLCFIFALHYLRWLTHQQFSVHGTPTFLVMLLFLCYLSYVPQFQIMCNCNENPFPVIIILKTWSMILIDSLCKPKYW